MVKRISFIIALTVLSVIAPVYTINAEVVTTIQVAPSTSAVTSEVNFTLSISVIDVTDLAVWEVRLFYLNTILNCTNIAEGPFLKEGGSTFFDSTINNTYNATHGWLVAGSTLLGQVPGVSGTGTVATITFQAIAPGDTLLQFDSDPLFTFLLDSSPPPRYPIPFTTLDGTVHVTGGTTVQDVAVTNVTSYKTIIGQEYSDEIAVTTENQGDHNETFNVTVYAHALTIYPKTTIVETRTVNNLINGTSTVLNFLWNTTGFAKGNYTISAYAEPVPGETNTANNNHTNPTAIMVGMPGDLMPQFGVIDMKDIAYVAKRFGTPPSEALWDPNADINSDGKVDMKDIAIVAKAFGKRDP